MLVRRLLRKHGYPPDKQGRATQTVLEQAETLCAGWAEEKELRPGELNLVELRREKLYEAGGEEGLRAAEAVEEAAPPEPSRRKGKRR